MNHNFKNKKILVVGLGQSGSSAIKALLREGGQIYLQDAKTVENIDKKVITYLDEKKVACFWGKEPEDLDYDYLVLSPGVPPHLDFIKRAETKGAQIIGELELAYILGKGNYVAITGTNGKTTTTTLVGEIFKEAGKETYVVGNIGVPVVSKALEASEDSWLITETSSFQLETIKEFRPKVSAILNLTPDHMDRHKTMAAYGEAKARIFENQNKEDYLVVNFDDKHTFQLARKSKAQVILFSGREELKRGAFVKDNKIVIRNLDEELIEVCATEDLKIPGQHNLENALAAVAIGYFAGIDVKTIEKTLKRFSGVEHRIEFCGKVNGVSFVNDSKGTNSDAAIKAIEAMKENIILIAGGYDKGSKFDELIEAFEGRVKYAILLGKTAVKIKETAERHGFTKTIIMKDMNACVKEAYRIAEKGDTVLLSPACASWDMYKSFEERGKDFKKGVEELEK